MNPKSPVQLLSIWYEKHARELPWRNTQDPYAIWVSEIMLQQTQVATVLPYYERFLKRFPTIRSLARANEAEVLSYWSGLGYYSRGRNLLKGAQYVEREFKGQIPRDVEILKTIPGIGPYTAGAISSIAYKVASPLVDGNVERVFSRYFGITERIDSSKIKKKFWEIAALWVEEAESPSILNQALMELGATVCVKLLPRCSLCPIQLTCEGRRKGIERNLPNKKKPRKKIDLWWLPILFEQDGQWFLQRNNDCTWWKGLWDFPRLSTQSPLEIPLKFIEWLDNNPGVVNSWQSLGKKVHTVTHHRIHAFPYLCRVTQRRGPQRGGPQFRQGKWFNRKQISDAPVSSLVKKILS